jgi:hypothetical protein
MRRAAIAIVLVLCGCGGVQPNDVKQSIVPKCPEGTAPLTAREVIGPVPRAYEVLAPEQQKPIDDYVAGLRKEMGSGYRNHDAGVIYRRGAREGTVVVVINTHEGRPEDVVAGAKEAERDEGIQGERLDVDGREGRLQHATDGSYVASAPAGECSVVLLVALEKKQLQDAAALIGARG